MGRPKKVLGSTVKKEVPKVKKEEKVVKAEEALGLKVKEEAPAEPIVPVAELPVEPVGAPAVEAKPLSLIGMSLGGKKIIAVGKKVAAGREFNEIKCEDGTAYLLTDHDVETQVKK